MPEAELELEDRLASIPSKKGFKGLIEEGRKGEQSPDPWVAPSEKDPLASVRDYLVRGRVKVHYKARKERSSLLTIFLIDSSGSMARDHQIAYIKGVLENTLSSYKDRRLRFASISLVDGGAELLTAPVLHARKVLEPVQALRTGGRTNLLEGFKKASSLIKEQERYGQHGKEGVRLFILTDGRVNAGDAEDPLGAAVNFYQRALRLGRKARVVDTEQGMVRIGEAERLARMIGAERMSLFEGG